MGEAPVNSDSTAAGGPGAPGPASRPVTARRSDRLPAPETTRLYAADWASFEAWCRRTRSPALPASNASVEAFLTSLATDHRPGTLRRRLAAIADRHRRAGYLPPSTAVLRRVLLSARAQGGDQPKQKAVGPEQLRLLAAACPGDRAGLRDRALFLLMAASNLGRTDGRPTRRDNPWVATNSSIAPARAGEPVAADPVPPSLPQPTVIPRAALLTLQVEDLRFSNDGLTFALADQADPTDPGLRRSWSVRRSPAFSSCPVHALEDWLRASEARFGPVFRKVDRWGNVEHRALTPTALRQILLRRGTAIPAHRPSAQQGAR